MTRIERRSQLRNDLGDASASLVRALGALDSAHKRTRGHRRGRVDAMRIAISTAQLEVSAELDRMDDQDGGPF